MIVAGWTGKPLGIPRLDDLALVESQAPDLPPGLADRLQVVSTKLASRPPLEIASLALVEPKEALLPPYRRLVDLISACGARIRQLDQDITGGAGDLRSVQAFLTDGAMIPLVGDGSFMNIKADTALMAAEALADWLAAGSEANLSGTVVISPDGDTAMLDRVLQIRGLPALWQSAASPWRGALQVLPLAFAVHWAPFDAKAMLDLLLLPRPPIARSAARKLARALAREPGIGGPAWDRAWSDIKAQLADRFAGDAEAESKIAGRLARWREWTSRAVCDRFYAYPAWRM